MGLSLYGQMSLPTTNSRLSHLIGVDITGESYLWRDRRLVEDASDELAEDAWLRATDEELVTELIMGAL